MCFVFDTRGNTKTASGKHYMDFCFSLDDLLSASRKHKTQPSFSPANFVFVQSTVAKPKTKSYTVKKVDRKVFLTTPQHGKNRSICNNTKCIHCIAGSLVVGQKLLLALSPNKSCLEDWFHRGVEMFLKLTSRCGKNSGFRRTLADHSEVRKWLINEKSLSPAVTGANRVIYFQ